jgi:hypothetical protein
MDRRWCARKYLTLGIRLEVPSYKKTLAATLLDLSPGGAFIETEVLLPFNSPLTVELKLPDSFSQNTFRLNARLVHRELKGAGMAFVGMSAGMIQALSEALSQYELRIERDCSIPVFTMSDISPYKKRLS